MGELFDAIINLIIAAAMFVLITGGAVIVGRIAFGGGL